MPAWGPRRECKRVRAVAPVGTAERHAVPFDVCPLQQLVERQPLAFVHDPPQPQRRQAADEALQAGVPLSSRQSSQPPSPSPQKALLLPP